MVSLPSRSTQIQAMLPTINEAKIPVAIGGTNYGLTHSGSQWVFRFRPHDGMSAKVIAKYLVEELGQKRWLSSTPRMLSATADATCRPGQGHRRGGGLCTGVQQRRERLHGGCPGLKKSGATAWHLHDFRDGPRRVRSPGQTTRCRCEMGRLSLHHGGRQPQPGGGCLYNTYGVADFHAEASPTSKTFATAYKAKYDKEPDFYAAWTYDSVLVFAEAVKSAGPQTREPAQGHPKRQEIPRGRERVQLR